MRRLLMILIASCAVLAFSCNDNAFDFSRLDSVDADGNWGIPIVDVQYSIEDVLNEAEDMPLHVSPEGMLQLEYSTEVDSVISSDQILQLLADQQVSLHGSQTVTLPALPPISGTTFTLWADTVSASLPADKVQIEMARVKSGLFQFSLTHNLPVTLTAEVSCPQLTDDNGNAFSQTFNIQDEDNQFSLAGYTLLPEFGNRLTFIIRLVLTTTGGQLPNTASLSYNLMAGNFVLEALRGKVAPVSLNVNKSIDLKLDYIAKTMGGNFTVYDPDIRCEVHNMFPIAARVVLEEAALHGPDVQPTSLISTTPATVMVPASTTDFEEVAVPISSSLTFSPKMNEARVSANVTFNPEGFNTPTMDIREGEFIHFKFSFVLPLHLKMDNVSFCDTMDFSQSDYPDIDGIHNLLVRCLFENGLPLDFFCQIYFYDSENRIVRDSLFDQRHLLVGGYDNQPSLSEVFITKENFNAIRDMLNCDKIILKATIDTDNHQVCIRNDQKLRLRMGAKFNLNLGELSQSLND